MTDIVQPKTTAEILTEARAFIEKGWTKYEFARNRFGASTKTRSNDAVCWCAIGAVRAVSEAASEQHHALLGALHHALPDSTYGFIAEFNDDPATTKEDILALFDRAIENAKAVANV